ncbi:MAG TPA: LytTR family DNA-binding domain-containing protein [Flavisolibacter sp.]|nr:LytTR family DNA-binding domain-containing protein [Flavisolibacter sp.]
MQLEKEKEEPRITSNPQFYPKKMILKHGIKHFLLDTNEIVYCYSNNKVVYIVDTSHQKYIYDKNLLHLETELDPKQFFKVNRTHIINFQFIRSFVTHEKNKIKVELRTGEKNETVVISQTRVNAFRQWIYKQL